MRYKYFILAIFISFGLFWFILDKKPVIDEPFLFINNHKIFIEVAANPLKKYKGLSERKNLCSDCGMLFLFNQNNDQPTFVMRNMNFGLDIIWLKNSAIVQIDKNLKPEGQFPVKMYNCEQSIDSVLEINAGLTEKFNFKIGDKISFKL